MFPVKLETVVLWPALQAPLSSWRRWLDGVGADNEIICV